jgi:hypothetical protein
MYLWLLMQFEVWAFILMSVEIFSLVLWELILFSFVYWAILFTGWGESNFILIKFDFTWKFQSRNAWIVAFPFWFIYSSRRCIPFEWCAIYWEHLILSSPGNPGRTCSYFAPGFCWFEIWSWIVGRDGGWGNLDERDCFSFN